MKSKAVRLYGKHDVRLEEFELPELKDDEILVKVYSDSVCMSTWKVIEQGKEHKRVPADVDKKPIIIGHEFAGEIIKVGKKWQSKFHEGAKFAQQPAIPGQMDSPGYSFQWFGGACTYCIFPNDIIEKGCIWEYDGDSYYQASLGEPMCCCIGGFHSNFHNDLFSYEHKMGTLEGGDICLLGGCGPMGLGLVSYGLVFKNKPKSIVVVDVDEKKINRAKHMITPEAAKEKGIELKYINSSKMKDPVAELRALTKDNKGFSDVFILTPIEAVAELGNKILSDDGCYNFFAGPTDKNFSAKVNLYNCHYSRAKIIGSTGANIADMKEAIELSSKGKIDPSVMVSHVGGIDSIAETTSNLPNMPGAKKLAYTQLNMPMTAIEDFEELGKSDPLFAKLDECCKRHNGLWSTEAEKLLFELKGVK